MTFYVNLTNGSNLAVISDGTINTTASSITLIGKNFPTYGQLLNTNLVHMLENFANTTSPSPALTGQIWYDSGNSVLKYYRGGSANNYWQNLPNIIYSATTPSVAQQNDMWYDSTNQQLKLYDQFSWITIGPQTTNDGLNRVSGTNSFIVQIGGNNVFTVDAYGRANMAYNPVYCGSGAVGTGPNFSGSGLTVPQTFVAVTTLINTGSYMNTSTGVFTCPVTGVYQVTGNMVSLGGPGYASTTQTITWWLNQNDSGINSKTVHANTISGTSDTNIIPISASGYLQCNAGDLLQLVYAADSGGQISYQNCNMSIRLVG